MDDIKSKSQKKREADALQDFGNQLIQLSAEELATLPLSEAVRDAIRDAKSIKSHGAKRRQSQLLGKLLRASDHTALLQAFEALQAESKAQTAHFHSTELWRDKLIQGGATELKDYIAHYQPENLPLLRQLLKKAQTARDLVQQKSASKALFRYLRTQTPRD